MTQTDQGSESPNDVVRRRVREVRERLGLSGRQVSERCAAAGYDLPRDVLTNIETGRRVSISVSELFALAFALGVAPVHLLLPLEDEHLVEITPGQSLDALHARRWVRGTLPYPAERRRDYQSEVPDSELPTADEQQAAVVFHQVLREQLLAEGLLSKGSAADDGER